MLNTKTKIKLAGISSQVIRNVRTLFGMKNQGLFIRKGVTWELDLLEGIDYAIFLQGVFEPTTYFAYKKIIKPGYTIIDIGANIGAHTLHFSRLTGESGQVYAFEPTDYAFNRLIKHIDLNKVFSSNIIATQAFLTSKEDDSTPLSIPSRWPLNAKEEDQTHPVHLGVFESLDNAKKIRLDDWYTALGKPKIHFIKIDVDGFEIDVLKGSKLLLKEQKPVLLMEFSPYVFDEKGQSFSELIEMLLENNYQCFLLNGKEIKMDNQLGNKIPSRGSINVILK
jgi:FkbM family methyltransferase